MTDQALPSTEGVASAAAAVPSAGEKAGTYAYYALLLLVVANFFNYVDRQIVSILASAIAKDLGLDDAQLGFILGTAFAVLYGVVGIAMGRIADALSRTKLMAAGLALWSAMTALSGAAVNFGHLAAARIGVGIGEAAANPCSHSLLSDYFPAKNRSAVLGFYLVGTHLGGAFALIFGGLLLQHWTTMCLSLPGDACGIEGWRAAFFVVGLPGLLLAILVASLREPARFGVRPTRKPLGLVVHEFSAAVPPFTLWNLFEIGGWPATIRNLALVGVLVAGAAVTGAVTGDWAQWIAVAIGLYSVVTWAQVLRRRDRPLYALTFGCKTFVFTVIGAAMAGCLFGTVHIWSTPYVMRTLGVSPAQAGLTFGVLTAVMAATSAVLGGYITDRWKRHDGRAPLFVCLFALLAPVPALVVMMQAQSFGVFTLGYAVFILFSMPWSGGIGALIQDLALPRMRGTASAVFSLIVILVTSGLGPYWAGKISALTGSLTTGLYSLLILAPVGGVFLLMAAARVRRETPAHRKALAEASGEPA
jgi:MFS family permease